jgi:protein-S-isoprenylcysteine O-methyltransferase Ste14
MGRCPKEQARPTLRWVILIAIVMGSVSSTAPGLDFTFRGAVPLATSAAIAGVIMSVSGVASFKRAGTSVNPLKPGSSSSLVCSGVYGFTRNPMYLGFLLMLVSWSIVLSNVLAFLVIPFFILYLNRFQIEPEELVLAARFGQEFVLYPTRVRRWL